MSWLRALIKLILQAPEVMRSVTHVRGLLAENHQRLLEINTLKRFCEDRLEEQQRTINELRTTLAKLVSLGDSSAPNGGNSNMSSSMEVLWAPYYKAFEDRFRGSKADIEAKQKSYLKILSEHFDWPKIIAVDLGCGRGEWLDLVAREGAEAIGIDSNDSMTAEVKRHPKLRQVSQDALSWLLQQKEHTFDLITAFHVVEHMEVSYLLKTLSEIHRVLKPGGVVLIETPNPENLLVGACNFYTDLTHIRPLPPATLGFAMDYLGFKQISCERLSPGMPSYEGQDPVLKDVARHFSVGQDYAIISKKI